MKAFLKENFVLVAGLALPLLLAFVFFISTMISASVIEPPRYSVIYATQYNGMMMQPLYFDIQEGKLILKYEPSNDKNRNRQIPQLYVFNPVTNKIRHIGLPDYNKEKAGTYPISELSSTQVSREFESPDGYRFDHNFRSDDNLMTAMFGGGTRYHNRNVLTKGNRRILIPNSGSYGNGVFIGWVIESEQQTP